MKKLVLFLMVVSAMGIASANTVWNPAANGIYPPSVTNWNIPANWAGGSGLYPGVNLGEDLKAVFNVLNAAECRVTGYQTTGALVMGENGPTDPHNNLLRIMNGGTLHLQGTAVGGSSWSAIGYTRDAGEVIVEAGGLLDIDAHLYLGMQSGGVGRLTVNGTVNVADTFRYARDAGALGYMDINAGGVFTARYLNTALPNGDSLVTISEGGLFVLTGGEDSDRDLTQALIDNGFMVAAPGAELSLDLIGGNWTVSAVPNPSTVPGNGDINLDRYVDEIDLSLLADQWLDPDPDPNADLTRDGNVDMADYQILAQNWLHNEYSKTLTGKIMSGYQGWFNHPGDGAGRGWVHWGGSNKFEPGFCSVDFWPDVSEYDADELYPTGFNYADGSVASVFSSYNQKTVLRHFSWMEEYGIDGAFLQRFVSETNPGSAPRNHRDQVMLHCQEAANLHKRAWAMMYDLSSNYTATEIKDKVINDWKHLVDTYQITKDPTDYAYLHHKGKPVVAVWGLLFDRSYEGQGTHDVIDFLANDPVYGGCAVMLGVGNDWLDLMDADVLLENIVNNSEIISPWSVGRYGSENTGSLDSFINNRTIPEQDWCNANGKDYLPVVWPGFSWYNNKHQGDPGVEFDQHPRLGGTFLWRQIYKSINDAGCTMIYQAMFDEVDEGTAIFKCSTAPPVSEEPTSYSNPFLPTGNAQHAPYDLGEALLPSDHYLWLLGEGAKMLRGDIPLDETMPTR